MNPFYSPPRATVIRVLSGVLSFAMGAAVTAHEHHSMDSTAGANADHSMPADHSMQDMAEDHTGHAMGMPGLIASSMSMESSGTAWQPQSTPLPDPMIHIMADGWMIMGQGNAYLIYDHAGGDRGGDKTISTNMFMLMARKRVGEGVLGLRGMISLEPATIGRSGYPLLLQTGETADGESHLIDRQHPHDLFMELAGSYTLPVRQEQDHAFVYLGLPGEPALGPATFMHRFSGMDNPEAPITHHWLDSTHITYGVATLGYIFNDWMKLEGSIFTGREPDQSRWDIETPKMDSQSVRFTVNPTADWSLQASYGHLNSPEQLEPEVDQQRLTASATYNRRISADGRTNWQTTFAWGRNDNDPGHTLDAFLVESAIVLNHTHTVFGRFERVQKDELFEDGQPLAGRAFWVNKLSLGYIYDFPETHHVQFGLGAVGSIHFLPSELEAVYGNNPTSYMLFARVRW